MEPVPLATFYIHIVLALITMFAITVSFVFHHDSPIFRGWAVLYIISTLAIIMSNYSYYGSYLKNSISMSFTMATMPIFRRRVTEEIPNN